MIFQCVHKQIKHACAFTITFKRSVNVKRLFVHQITSKKRKKTTFWEIFMCIKTINYILSSLTYEPPPECVTSTVQRFPFSFFVGRDAEVQYSVECFDTYNSWYILQRVFNTKYRAATSIRNAATGMKHICTKQNRIFISIIVVLSVVFRTKGSCNLISQ